jgi:hypothetical protein
MIAKARFKSLEDMPVNAKCCAKTIELMTAFCSTEIEIDTETGCDFLNYCPFCGVVYNVGIAFRIVNSSCRAKAAHIDIDEGVSN